MISFRSDRDCLNRLTLWLAIGSTCALGFLVAVLLGLRLGESCLKPALQRTLAWFTSGGLKSLERSGRDDHQPLAADLGPDMVKGTRLGQLAGESPGGNIGPHSDSDEALFSALERLERRISAATSSARQSVVALEYTAADAAPGTRRIASGVVISNRGDVLSVRIDPPATQSGGTDERGKSPAPIVARDFSGRRHVVHWVAADSQTGLTLLRLSPRSVRPIRVADDEPNLGSQVFIVGNPFGMGHSVSRGHVAGLDRTLELSARQLGGLLQVQAPLYPGDSGAAVVNLRGEWLGLIRSGLAIPGSGSGRGTEADSTTPLPSSRSPVGFSPSMTLTDNLSDRLEPDNDFGFAIPTRDALWVAEQLRTHGCVDRAYLGVRLEPGPATRIPRSDLRPGSAGAGMIEPDKTRISNTPSDGAILHEVLAGTPAAVAGLRPGDKIVALNGRAIRCTHDLTDRLDHIPARTTILLSVVRGGDAEQEPISLSVSTASRPDPSRLIELAAPTQSPVPKRSTIPVALTATAAATVPRSSAKSAPTINPGGLSRPSGSRVALPTPRPSLQDRTESAVPKIEPDELRLTLPRAVVERLEQLERRLEQLESSAARASGATAIQNRQISTIRKP